MNRSNQRRNRLSKYLVFQRGHDVLDAVRLIQSASTQITLLAGNIVNASGRSAVLIIQSRAKKSEWPCKVIMIKEADKNCVCEKIQPALLSIVQVCQILNISRPEYYRLNSTGKFAPLPVPLCSKILYNRIEIERWIQAGCPHRKIWQDMKKQVKFA
jgi:predicted DNA-binding transcriptional regulator AlpA